MFSVREPFDRKAVRGERRRTNRGNTGKGSEDLAIGLGKQRHDFYLDSGDVCSESTISVQVTTQPLSTLISIGRRWQTLTPASYPVLSGIGGQPSWRAT